MIVQSDRVNEEAIEIDTLRVLKGMSFVVHESPDRQNSRQSPSTVALSGDARVPIMLNVAVKSIFLDAACT